MRTPGSGWWRSRAACAHPDVLPLVDAAYERPGGPAGREMVGRICAHCPVAVECLAEAMAVGEYGIWGGTSSKQRTRHGAPRAAGLTRPVSRYGPITV